MIKNKFVLKFIILYLSSSGLLFGHALQGNAETNLEFFFGQTSKAYEDIVVKEVLNIDTLRLDNGEIIKLIGLNPLAFVPQKKKIERDTHGFVIKEEPRVELPLPEKAHNYVVHLLEGKHVRIEFDAEKKNANLETIAYVFLKDTHIFVNAEILRQGYANLRTSLINNKYEDQLREAYQNARKEKRGLHGQ